MNLFQFDAIYSIRIYHLFLYLKPKWRTTLLLVLNCFVNDSYNIIGLYLTLKGPFDMIRIMDLMKYQSLFILFQKKFESRDFKGLCGELIFTRRIVII